MSHKRVVLRGLLTGWTIVGLLGGMMGCARSDAIPPAGVDVIGETQLAYDNVTPAEQFITHYPTEEELMTQLSEGIGSISSVD